MKEIADNWPVVKGDYALGNQKARVAVVTLASHLEAYPEAALWGSLKTENLGVEKIIANTISNSNIRYILICGAESRGHLAGHSLLAIHANGIDDKGRIIGSEGAIPFIENVPVDAVERFRKQVVLLDHIGLTDLAEIRKLVDKYKNMGEAYSEESFVVFSPKKRHIPLACPAFGDVVISNEFGMDAASGVIFQVATD